MNYEYLTHFTKDEHLNHFTKGPDRGKPSGNKEKATKERAKSKKR